MSDISKAHFTATDLIDRMTTEFGYSSYAAQQVATDLEFADSRIKQAFWQWWTTGEVDTSLDIQGYTVDRLLAEKRAATPVAAFDTLSLLVKDPRTALRSLKWQERKPRFRSVPGS